jgi:arsenate reductase-like glutaredoxin family protein
MPKRIDPKELTETISEIVKARNIQKAKVNQNKMIEEMQEEEIAKFQKPVVEEVHKIIPAFKELNYAIEQSTKIK